jgi:hypothetical protein
MRPEHDPDRQIPPYEQADDGYTDPEHQCSQAATRGARWIDVRCTFIAFIGRHATSP